MNFAFSILPFAMFHFNFGGSTIGVYRLNIYFRSRDIYKESATCDITKTLHNWKEHQFIV